MPESPVPERRVFILDSTTQAESARHAGGVIVSGSHSGANAAGYAVAAQVAALVSNDAGFGLEGAGVSGFVPLAAAGIAAASVSHNSAKIGDGQSTWETGIISAVNELAAACGVQPGQSTPVACECLKKHAR